MWEAMEIKAGKDRIVEIEGRSRKKMERKRGKIEEGKEKTKERKNNGSKESSRRMGDLG